MQEYIARQENVWIKILDIDMSAEKAAVIEAIKSGNIALANNLSQQIQAAVQGQPTDEEVVVLNSIYTTKKPALEESDSYEFIGMNVYEQNGEYSSILNCRVNGEHIQIRS